jgi:hypothetical protein
MIQYEYLGAKRRSKLMDDDDAATLLGERILSGSQVAHWFTQDKGGRWFDLIAVVSGVTGKTWCVFYDPKGF